MKTGIKMLAAAAIVMVCSCTDALEERIDSLEARMEALEAKVQANVDAIEKLVAANKSAVTINSVTATSTGYVISFSDGTTATLTNGNDGKDGANGTNGKDGKDGKDGVTPVIGITEINGVFCWTVNGTPLKNGDEYVPVTGTNGTDGKDGANGTDGKDGKDGKDGISPKFKVENGKWFVSYDNGGSWEEVGSAVTEAGQTITVTETETEYVFTIGEGNEIRIPKTTCSLTIKLITDKVKIEAGRSAEFGYVLTGADETTHVVAEAQYYTATVDEKNCIVTVTAPESLAKGYVIVKAVRNSDGASCSQYVVFDKDVYGIYGSIIWTGNDEDYINW